MMAHKHFISGNLVACDTETTGLRLWHGDAPFAFSFCNEDGQTAYFEWTVDPKTRQVRRKEKEWEMLRAFFEDESIKKVFFNAKFDIRGLEIGHGITVAGPGGSVSSGNGRVEEVSFMARCCNTRENGYGLKKLANQYGIMDDTDEQELHRAVVTLRRRASKDGWKIGYTESEDAEGQLKHKAEVASDYWIPRTAVRLGVPWANREWTKLCERYARKDAERTMLLYLMYKEWMDRIGVRKTYKQELKLLPTVYRMEARGVTVHEDRVDRMIVDTKKTMRGCYSTIENEYGWPKINLRSPKQVAKMLFDDNKVPLGTPRKVKGKWTNPRSTAIDDLSKHSTHPAVSALLRYRTCEKGLGSFLLKYKRIGIERHAGLLTLHSSFNQMGTDTHRFSSSDPNLQQVSSPESSRHGAVLAVREPFGPRPGMVWLASDYDGQEIRLYAEVSQEPNMMKALANGRDIHSMIISRICGGENNPIAVRAGIQALGLDGRSIDMNDAMLRVRRELGVRDGKQYSLEGCESISRLWLKLHGWDIEKAEKSIGKKNTRGRLKQSTFGKIYGARPKTLAQTLQVPLEEAEGLNAVYQQEFPDIDAFTQESIREARKNGYIVTLWGRRINVDPERAYTAVSYKCQGAASDLIKQAMLNLDEWYRDLGIDASILMPIHDEIIDEVPKHACTLSFVREHARRMEDHKGHLKFTIPTKPLIIVESWHRPRTIRGYKYA